MAELQLVRNDAQLIQELPEYQQEWVNIVRDVREYSEHRVSGLNIGFPMMHDAINGLGPGLIFIAGQPNIGKSALCLQMAWGVANSNDNVYVIYFSLDDNDTEIVPRIVSMTKRIPISAVKYPLRFAHDTGIMTKRAEGFRDLEAMASRFKLLDSDYGHDIASIEEVVRKHKIQLPDGCHLCVFIDNFYNIKVKDARFKDGDEQSRYITHRLKMISDQDVPVICTIELRKLNGNRRPTTDDVFGSVHLQYEAEAIMLCYNEVGLRGNAAEIYWNMSGSEEKQPVMEVRLGKNKMGEFKGRLFYQFWPHQSFLTEVPSAGAQLYNSRISV